METSSIDVKEQYRDANNLRARAAIYRFATSNVLWPRWVFDQLDLPASARVLEIGCGAGGLWKENLDRVPAGWRLVLSDLSPGMLDESRRMLGTRAALIQADASALPFADARFNAVIANHMLYHLPDLSGALREIRRVLVPAGRLYAATNSADHLSRIKDLFEEFLGTRSPLTEPLAFRLENANALLSPHFAKVEIRSLHGELRVTDPEAILAYVMSTNDSPRLIMEAKQDELRSRTRREIEARGAFVLGTHAGMCIATK